MDKELRAFIREEENYATIVAKETEKWQRDDKNHKVYLYGAGYLCQYYVRYCQVHGIQIEKILDRDKSGKYRNDILIERYDEFIQEGPEPSNCRFFITTSKYEAEVRTLLEQTFPSHNIFFVDWAFQFEFNDLSLDDYRQYLDSHWEELVQLETSLADECSKQTLGAILREHISGNPAYTKGFIASNLFPTNVMQFKKNEVFVELGANNGDTFKDFVQECPDYHTAWLFEPEECYQPILAKIREEQNKEGKSVHIVKKGAWDKEDTLCFLSTNEGSGTFTERPLKGNVTQVEVTTVDATVSDDVTFIKMDIEGAELRALHGAAMQIKENHPKLAVCVYHKCVDLLDIWSYLRFLAPDYRFYLRAHTPLWDDIYLYAV